MQGLDLSALLVESLSPIDLWVLTVQVKIPNSYRPRRRVDSKTPQNKFGKQVIKYE